MLSKFSSRLIRLAAVSAVIAGSVASAQIVKTVPCPGCTVGGGVPNYPTVDVNALATRVSALEQKLAALEAKYAVTDGNVTKLMTHTHDVTTSFDFSSSVVSDINSAHQTVAIPIGTFGHPAGVSGAPKFK